MRTANPTLGVFNKPQTWDDARGISDRAKVMTLGGTIFASTVLIGITATVATIAWSRLQDGDAVSSAALPTLIGSAIGGFVLAIIIVFKPKAAPFLSPVYAAVQGVFVGAISLVVARMLDARMENAGIGLTTVFQAITLTFGIFAAMLIGYASGILKFGQVVKNCIMAATGGIMIFYMAAILLSFVGVTGMSGMLSFNNGSPISIGFSLFVVVIASLNLVLDFEFIEKGVQAKAPKYLEWYGAFALLVTLVWLYIEILRLLSKLRGRH